ncbi:hypothetical protein CoNPh11_CDS0009 [Staphylococcus phage S-CoN_Ph11]|nr:hypothetical protein CoNPh11_CDS0009 [Staphylococcus phage S-CoN_Ph11]
MNTDRTPKGLTVNIKIILFTLILIMNLLAIYTNKKTMF